MGPRPSSSASLATHHGMDSARVGCRGFRSLPVRPSAPRVNRPPPDSFRWSACRGPGPCPRSGVPGRCAWADSAWTASSPHAPFAWWQRGRVVYTFPY
ncbi:hypothetical protein D187_002838 [Cystobacter fuscus DSM 2262]|uniref:Uncharacterized protein n=1 Tax=Cystobacter fuscus (strain ATCC 25194 / DSM 2262 / NBRC 100088 / M29) TaxID=1242864 RepID=S9QRU6_CYSF2|nr:hypothetical protein D187_002838 [Cystobacter fuscus DSM 2262]